MFILRNNTKPQNTKALAYQPKTEILAVGLNQILASNMNHLCGLDSNTGSDVNNDASAVFWSSLPNYDAEELKRFRLAYNQLRPTTFTKKGTNSPQFLVPTDDSPSECGWRPLDDITLYRFLCADVINSGSSKSNKKFQSTKSMDRLQRALLFRKEKRVDDLLHDIVISTTSNAHNNHPSTRKNMMISQPPSSYSRMASGSLSPCGNHIANIQITAPTTKAKPKRNKKLLVHRHTTETTASSSSESSSSVVDDNDDYDDDRSISDIMFVGRTNVNSTTILKDLDKYQRLRVRVFTGRDYQGYPVMFERLGEFLGSGNSNQFTDEEWCRFYIWDLERHFVEMRNSVLADLQKRKKKTKNNNNSSLPPMITKYTFCGDCSGIVSSIFNGSIWNVVPLLKVLVRSVEDFYPEIAARIVLFNFPRAATVIYRAVKSFLDPVTASKICILSGVPSAKVFDMPLDAIPKEYGGTSPVEYPKTASS